MCADELALLAAAAQRWRLTPAAWGGAPTDGFAGASFDAIGVERLPLHPGLRRTASGLYRVVPLPPCSALDRAAVRTGLDPGGDGLLVIGWDPVSGVDQAVVVLSALVQVPLARVPWEWVATLSAAPRRPPPPASTSLPADPPRPIRPARADDRALVRTGLRRVGWPDPPQRDAADTQRGPPARGAAWRRSAQLPSPSVYPVLQLRR